MRGRSLLISLVLGGALIAFAFFSGVPERMDCQEVGSRRFPMRPTCAYGLLDPEAWGAKPKPDVWNDLPD